MIPPAAVGKATHRLYSTGPDTPGKWLSSHPWGYLEGMKMWHLGTWLSSGLSRAGLMGGFDDLGGLFQGNQFNDSVFRR